MLNGIAIEVPKKEKKRDRQREKEEMDEKKRRSAREMVQKRFPFSVRQLVIRRDRSNDFYQRQVRHDRLVKRALSETADSEVR